MSLSTGQAQALEQLHRIADRPNSPLEILLTTEPTEKYKYLVVQISLSCSQYERLEGGLPLAQRERFRIYIPPDFPFDYPSIYATHRRFAGNPHVQWGKSMCLYQAPDTEWDPSDGMYGFCKRLETWLTQGARGELDAIGGPIHPPVTYRQEGPLRHAVIHPNTPAFDGTTWFGFANLKVHSKQRVDVTAWHALSDPVPDGQVGAAILLSEPLPFEFPTRVSDLFHELTAQHVSKKTFLFLIELAAIFGNDGDPLYVFIGTPMRGIAGSDERQQHITAWYIDSPIVDGLRMAMRARGLIRQADTSETVAAAEKLTDDIETIIIEWLSDTKIAWCKVMENRPEIVTRRDMNTSMQWFKNKTVALWGCGALGSHVAHLLVRAGVKHVHLYDHGKVTPGLLIRQTYEDKDIGEPKAKALHARLHAINPNLSVDSHHTSVVDDMHGIVTTLAEVDVLIDTTANTTVHKKLELVCRELAVKPPVAAMMISKMANKGVVTLANRHYTGCTYDVLRKTKIDISRQSYAEEYKEAFWPTDPIPNFQPEPGCSDPTFIASAADIATAAATMMNHVATGLVDLPETQASTDFVATRDLNPGIRAHLHLTYEPDVISKMSADRYEVRMAPAAVRNMSAWIKTATRTTAPEDETGGVLFGQRDDACGVIWVSEICGPPPDSEASPEGFICGVEGLNELNTEKSERTQRAVEYLGMWHTHPSARAKPSHIDVAGMTKLLSSPTTTTPLQLMLIVGLRATNPELGFYLFDRREFALQQGRQKFVAVQFEGNIEPLTPDQYVGPEIGLALSGGGSRAIAFHLGTLRALNDLDLLKNANVISGVSGGAVLAGCYAYSDGDFEAFDKLVTELLRQGLVKDIAKHAFSYQRLLYSAGTVVGPGAVALISSMLRHVIAQSANALGLRSKHRPDWIDHIQPPFPRLSSRTHALADTLREQLFGDKLLSAARRDDINVVINACELRTGTAFRFGSQESGNWRFGQVLDNEIQVADAVAMSAAYPLLLPASDRRYQFEKKNGELSKDRVIITDGGVFDNLGVSCMEPGRSSHYSYNTYQPSRIICSSAGPGIFSDHVKPFWWPARMARSFESVFRKVGDSTFEKLHRYNDSGDLDGFILVYLGQRDDRLPWQPPDLITREMTNSYPTDFFSMRDDDIHNLSLRGEQLTRLLIEHYW